MEAAPQRGDMDLRALIVKLNMVSNHQKPNGMELSWDECCQLRDLLAEMSYRIYGDNINIEDWSAMCEKVSALSLMRSSD